MTLLLILVGVAVVIGAVGVWIAKSAEGRRQRLLEDYAEHAPPIAEQHASKKYWRSG